MAHILIEEFKPQYAAEAGEVVLNSLREMGSTVFDYVNAPVESDVTHIARDYTGRSHFWVALSDGEVVGTVAVKEISKEIVELKRLYVMKKLHGKGVAQMLLSTALLFAQKNGYKKMKLETHKLMTRAHSFYEKVGFRKVSEDGEEFLYERMI